MIHESEVKKAYGNNVQVIRKGDKDWTSDAQKEIEAVEKHPGLQSTLLQQRTRRPYVAQAPDELGDPAAVPEWTEVVIGMGPDQVKFRSEPAGTLGGRAWVRRAIYRGANR